MAEKTEKKTKKKSLELLIILALLVALCGVGYLLVGNGNVNNKVKGYKYGWSLELCEREVNKNKDLTGEMFKKLMEECVAEKNRDINIYTLDEESESIFKY